MSLIEFKSSDLSEESEDGASHAEPVDDVQSDDSIGGRAVDSNAVEPISNETDSTSTVHNEEPGDVAGSDDRISTRDLIFTTSSPSPSTTTPPVASSSAPCSQETQTTGASESTTILKSVTPFVGPVRDPVIKVYSPYIEDQRVMPPGPNVFENNIRNAIESRKQEEKTGRSDGQENKKGPDVTSSIVKTDPSPYESVVQATPNNNNVLKTDGQHDETSFGSHGKTEQTHTSVEEHGEPDQAEISVPEGSTKKEENETSIEVHGNMNQDKISVEAICSKEEAADIVVEPCNKEKADTLIEAHSNNEVADTPVEANNTKKQEETTVPTEIIPGAEHPREVETQNENPQTQPADAETLAQAKEWHDSIVRRVARLRGLSCWLGERNKRMDGMVEILVRSLEHMGVGAVTDHIGNLIPLQNFRLNSAIKLSSTDSTWTTCDDEIMSNDINAWLPDSLPDDHNVSLTNEQMRKYESQVEALRAENESLQRSLQTALDNQGSLGVQINQWQACIDSAGQQLCRVTQEVHESKSRERHLRHLLGEERRIKDSLLQQNSLTKAEQQDHAAENVTCWPQSNDGLSGPSQSATSATAENSATYFVQGVAADKQHMIGNVAFNNYAGSPSAQTTVKASPVTERPWQHRQNISSGPRSSVRSSRLNSSAPAFVSAYSSSYRQNYRGNWQTGNDLHPRFGSGRNFGSSTGRGRHSSGRGYYRKENSTHAGINRLLDGFFDNLNRIENALRQQGISVPGPTANASQVAQQQQQQVVSSNVCMQYPMVQDLQQQQQQTAPNQPIYYSPPMQPVVYAEPENVVAQPVQSIPSMQQVPQSPTVVHQAIQPHVQFAQVEGQAY